VRLRGKKRREFQVHPESSPWIEDETNRVVGVHRHVRVTVVGREVGAYNGFTERVTTADLFRLAEWLEDAAAGGMSTVELGTADEGVRLEHSGLGSLVAELRGELRPWYWDEPADVVQFKLEVEPEELRQGARDLRGELEAWLD
jgi:hypothetical protein